MPRALIIGAGFANKGAEAMLKTARSELCARIPNIDVYAPAGNSSRQECQVSGITPICYSNSPRLATYAVIHPLKALQALADGCRERSIHMAFHELAFQNQFEKHRNFDTIIDVSGYAYADIWGMGQVRQTLNLIKRFPESRVYFLPQAWGPFTNTKLHAPVRSMIAGSRGVWPRDVESAKYLSGIGVGNLNSVTPDIVFSFHGDNRQFGQQWLRNKGCDSGKLLLGVVPNMRVVDFKMPLHDYANMLASAIDGLVAKYQCEVLLMPNEISPLHSSGRDDRFLCSVIMAKVRQKSSVFVMKELVTAEEMFSIVGNLSLVVSSRFHSLVFALSNSVPVVALGWSHKYAELLRLLDLADMSSSADQQSSEALVAQVSSAIDRRKEISEQISAKLPEVRGRVSAMFDFVATDILEGLARWV